jgi:hypothetical protein
MPRGEGGHASGIDACEHARTLPRTRKPSEEEGFAGERYSPAEGRCGLGGEGGAALSRPLCIGRLRGAADPSNGAAFRAALR